MGIKRDQIPVDLPTEEAQNEESSVLDLEAARKRGFTSFYMNIMTFIVHGSVTHGTCNQKFMWNRSPNHAVVRCKRTGRDESGQNVTVWRLSPVSLAASNPCSEDMGTRWYYYIIYIYIHTYYHDYVLVDMSLEKIACRSCPRISIPWLGLSHKGTC